MASLIIQSGKHKGKKIALPDKEVIIGRDETCYIRMTSTEVSRHHCTLTPTPDGILVRDLTSQNGTLINHAPIEKEKILEPGDFLQVGPIQFQLEGQKSGKSGFKDDDIFGWLSEGDTATEIPNVSDTTIVKASQVPGAAKPEAPRKTFKSVAEEAQDIIRRHKESLEEK